MSKLSTLCESLGLVLLHADDWAVLLRVKTLELMVISEMGNHRPAVADFVSGLLLDAGTLEDSGDDFARWAGLVGYAQDESESRRLFDRTRRMTGDLRRVLGGEFNAASDAMMGEG